jgi:hypothetical protein
VNGTNTLPVKFLTPALITNVSFWDRSIEKLFTCNDVVGERDKPWDQGAPTTTRNFDGKVVKHWSYVSVPLGC